MTTSKDTSADRRNIGLIRDRGLVVAFCFAMSLLDAYVYKVYLADTYAYRGFSFDPAAPEVIVLAWVLALLPALWMPTRLRRPSETATWIIYQMVVLPGVVTPVLQHPGWGGLVNGAPWLLGSMIVLKLTGDMPPPHWVLPRFSPRVFAWLLVTAGAVLLAGVLKSFDIDYVHLDFDTVYERRAKFQEDAAHVPAVLVYGVMWGASILGPLAIFWGHAARRYGVSALGAAVVVVGYLLTANKTFIMSPAFFALIYAFFASKRMEGRTVNLLLWILGVSFVLMVVDAVAGTGWSDYVTRRALVVPGVVSSYYFDFFSKFPHTGYGDKLLAGIFSYPYETSLGKVIGTHYLNNSESNATASAFAEAYAHGGGLLALASAALLGMVMWCLDGLCRRLSRPLAMVAAVILAMKVAESGIQTVLLTWGGLFMLALLVVLPRPTVIQRRAGPLNKALARAGNLFAAGLAFLGRHAGYRRPYEYDRQRGD